MYYRKKEEKKEFRPCDQEGCKEEGLHKAPKKNSHDYHYFCQKHASEYNKNWNFYKDMDEKEIGMLNDFDIIGRRKTWKMGVGINPKVLEKIKGLEDPFKILEKYNLNFDFTSNSKGDPTLNNLPREHITAIKILGISWPTTKKELNQKYKELSKRYHPDITGGNKEKEEKFKQVSASYHFLLKNIKK